MGHKKLKRFAEIKTFSNVFQYPEEMPGKWHGFFNNTNPIVLELACGKGEYTISLAEKYPGRNFIGVDLKGNRIWKGASFALKNGLKNAAFLRTQIEMIASYFVPNEVEEIWITFPDPQLQFSRAKKRLTHPRFLTAYEKIIRPGGIIHLKTDSPDLYLFTKEVIDWCGLNLITDIPDIGALAEIPEDLQIQTHYESLNISDSGKIHYLSWRLPKKWNRDIPAFKSYYTKKFYPDET